MRKILLSITCFVVGYLNAQVGIGTATPSADLHVLSNKEYIFTLIDSKVVSDNYVLTANDSEGKIKKEANSVFNTIKFLDLTKVAPKSLQIIPKDQTFTNFFVGDWISLGEDTSISLSHGRWAVAITSLISLDEFSDFVPDDYLITTLTIELQIIDSSNKPSIISVDVEGDKREIYNGRGSAVGALVFPTLKDILRGTIIINNPQEYIKDYYFAVRFILETNNHADSVTIFNSLKDLNMKSILDNSNENQVYAIPLN